MILTTCFLVFIAGLWNKPRKLKSTRSGRCACHPLCPESHMECPLNSEVWNSILILSCLSALLPLTEAHDKQELIELKAVLVNKKSSFENSTALLYTPDTTGITDCGFKFFDCFLMEWIVFLHDKSLEDYNNSFIIQKSLSKRIQSSSKDHQCELQELKKPSEFYKALINFIESRLSCQ